MINKEELKKGWNYAANTQGVQIADFNVDQYISNVVDEINKLEQDINDYTGSNQGKAQLGGYVAERWQADTFNIRAVAAQSEHRAWFNSSNKHASADISTNFDKEYSLKYLKTAEKSVKAQAKNVIQNYHEYYSKAKSNGNQSPMLFDEYLEKYGYSNDMDVLLKSVYEGQVRIIPSDQLEEGINKLNRLIATESARGSSNRFLNLKNYLETLKNLDSRIKDGEGIESRVLTKEESMAIAELCRTGEFKASDFGVTLESEVIKEIILDKALQSGITAGTITFIIQLVPQLIDLIAQLVNENQIDFEKIKKDSITTVSNTAKSFIAGYLTCSLYASCKIGKLGAELVDIQPGVIGTIVSLTMNIVVESFEYATGRESIQEYKYHITKNAIISISALVGGTIAVAALPYANALSFMIGSMIGSVMASISISVSEKIYISFCVDTGYTLFGLVKQDYYIPEEILKDLGLNFTVLNRSVLGKSELSRARLNRSSLNHSELSRVDINIMRRGIISFHCVGYIFD